MHPIRSDQVVNSDRPLKLHSATVKLGSLCRGSRPKAKVSTNIERKNIPLINIRRGLTLLCRGVGRCGWAGQRKEEERSQIEPGWGRHVHGGHDGQGGGQGQQDDAAAHGDWSTTRSLRLPCFALLCSVRGAHRRMQPAEKSVHPASDLDGSTTEIRPDFKPWEISPAIH